MKWTLQEGGAGDWGGVPALSRHGEGVCTPGAVPSAGHTATAQRLGPKPPRPSGAWVPNREAWIGGRQEVRPASQGGRALPAAGLLSKGVPGSLCGRRAPRKRRKLRTKQPCAPQNRNESFSKQQPSPLCVGNVWRRRAAPQGAWGRGCGRFVGAPPSPSQAWHLSPRPGLRFSPTAPQGKRLQTGLVPASKTAFLPNHNLRARPTSRSLRRDSAAPRIFKALTLPGKVIPKMPETTEQPLVSARAHGPQPTAAGVREGCTAVPASPSGRRLRPTHPLKQTGLPPRPLST